MNPAPADVVDKAKLKMDGCTGLVVLVFYKTLKIATDAVTKLHGQSIKGQAAKKGAAASLAAAPGISVWARQVSGDGAHVKKWRVIIRNLPFQVREYCQPLGPHYFTAIAPTKWVSLKGLCSIFAISTVHVNFK